VIVSERNILIIDDSSTIRHGIHLVLKQARLFDQYFEAASAQEGLEYLENNTIEVVLCDIVMPGMDGFEFLKEMKSREMHRDIPVIMLTGQESVDKKIKGLEMGASDYLLKPFDPGELIARVRVQLKVKRLQDELKVAKQRYKELSITDYLTQIYNRRYFMELFDLEFSRATRYKSDLSVIIFDLDNFKNVNDTHGHLVGDKVLRQLSELVRSEIRNHDIFARYGGEEFILMLPQTPTQGAFQVSEKIRKRIESVSLGGLGRGQVTVSMGIATFKADAVNDGKDLISFADSALYRAKLAGKNRVEIAEL
jgi:diguanylate cyclase (GGDEF)-like protein